MAASALGTASWRDRLIAPLPRRVEDVCLRYAWLIVLINLLGTGFGFWYYRFQLAATPMSVWPWIPDSPIATLFMALSLALYKLGRQNEVINMLAFYGNIKLGVWTPYTLLLFRGEFGHDPAMFQFLFWSHLLMVAQAFLIQRYATFAPWAIVLALVWYTIDLMLDYFIPIADGPHHTWIPVPRDEIVFGTLSAFDLIAAGETILTIWITVLAFYTMVVLRSRRETHSH